MREFFDIQEHPGYPLIILGVLILLWSFRRASKKLKEKQKLGQRDPKDNPKTWV